MSDPLQGKIHVKETKPIWNEKILLYGTHKSGKTHFAGTYSKGPIHYYGFDPGGEKTFRNLEDSSNITMDTFGDLPIRDQWGAFSKVLTQDFVRNNLPEYMLENGGIIVFDSLTTMTQAIMHHILKTNARKPDATPTLQEWGIGVEKMLEFLRTIVGAPCAVLLLTHYDIYSDEDSGRTMAVPTVVGRKWAPKIGLYFDNIWHIYNRGDKFYLSTKTRSMFDAGGRIGNLDGSIENPTLDMIYDAVMQP